MDTEYRKIIEEVEKTIEEQEKKKTQMAKKAELMSAKLDLTIDGCIKHFRKCLTAVISPDDPLFDNSKRKLTAAEVEECLPPTELLRGILDRLADATIELAIDKLVDKY